MRALISVYDKSGVVEFAKILAGSGYELISTGGTHQTLSQEGGLEVMQVSVVTGSTFEGCFRTSSSASCMPRPL